MIKQQLYAPPFGKNTLFSADRSAQKCLILIYIKFRTKKAVSTGIFCRSQEPSGLVFGRKYPICFPSIRTLSAE
jgi:hypothetical protein